MEKFAIFFDLDGTLTDSGEGITKCAQLALSAFGIEITDRTELRAFVGPPLRESFPRFGVPEEQVEEAIRIFRGRYLTVGKFENTPYPGIFELLTALRERGYPLYMATSKPEVTAVEILQKFQLEQFFDRICGATMDSSRDSKEAVIGYLLDQLEPGVRAVMVGDTAFDVLGAASHGLPTIGVSWGYGSVQELQDAGARIIADTPEALLQVLTTW